MPIPAAPDGTATPAAVTLTLFLQVHDQLRDELRDLDDESLNFVPGGGMNSIAVIIRHLVGSEAETLRAVAGVPNVRDRDAEFVPARTTVAEVRDLLGTADALIDHLRPLITETTLQFESALPTLPPNEVRPGLTWLVGNYGHAREHVGQIQLTKQLARMKPDA